MNAAPGLVVDAFAALVPGGGIGRFVRLLSTALRTLPDAPAARFAVTRNPMRSCDCRSPGASWLAP